MQTNRFNISTTYYTPDQWSKLSAALRAQVLNARGTKHNISAMESSMDGAPYHNDCYVDDYYLDDSNFAFASPDDTAMETSQNIDAVAVDYADVAQSQLPSTQTDTGSHAGDDFGQRSRACLPDHYIEMFESSSCKTV
jgi:hypothetical protein